MPEQWPRALLRAALREAGYDAVGATDLAAALRYGSESRGRGPVQAVLLDQAVLEDEESATLLNALLRRHQDPAPMLLARAMPASPLPGATAPPQWRRVIRRPASIADLVAAVQGLLPLPPESARPVD
jgi:DNA-binding response OmpR family regulator